MSALLDEMIDKLSDLIPMAEIKLKYELIEKINFWKKKRNAIILGHNYMEATLFHFAADITGDSLGLCHEAAKSEHDILVFCGVEFMAETAKIINPERKVLIPSSKAGCSLASSITAADVTELKKEFPSAPVVSYINTFADVKAQTDVCCTSGNAQKVIESLDSETIIFIPDEYLSRNVAKTMNKRVVYPKRFDKAPLNSAAKKNGTFVVWPGRCEVHEKFVPQDILDVRMQFPSVKVLAHPECPPDVIEQADYMGSTKEMINYVKENHADNYLLMTECAMADNIIAANKEKEILRMCSHRCPHMAQITLEDTLNCLQNLEYEVKLDEDIRLKAKRSIDRMLKIF